MKIRQLSWIFWSLSMVLASIIFGFWPGVDLELALHFYQNDGFVLVNRLLSVQFAYYGVPRIATGLTIAVLVILLLRRWRSKTITRGLWRKSLAWLLIVWFGVGVLVHEGLKNQVGRPRPSQVVQMGGQAPFVPTFQISDHCARNCSFVSGHSAIGFCLMVFGMWSAPIQRRRWWLAGVMAGSSIGLVRMLQGGHFLSDVVFSFLAIWGCSLAIRQTWLLWRFHQLRAADHIT